MKERAIKKSALISYLIAALGVVIGGVRSPRIGAITIAMSLVIFAYPDFRQKRIAEKVIVLALVVSLVTVALALPRR